MLFFWYLHQLIGKENTNSGYMRKKKTLITALAGCFALISTCNISLVYAEEIFTAPSVIEMSAESVESDIQKQEGIVDEMESFSDEATTDAESAMDDETLVTETELLEEESDTDHIDNTDSGSSEKEEESEDLKEEKTESEESEDAETQTENESTLAAPYGEAALAAEYEEITSLDLTQTYYFQYSETDEGERDEYIDSAVLSFELDTGFSAQTIQTGTWNGFDGMLCIRLYGKAGGLVATQSVYQGDSLDVSGYEDVSRIEILSERYSDEIADVSVSGIIDKKAVGDPISFSAVYMSGDLNSNHASAKILTPTTYINLPLPEVKTSADSVYYGDSLVLSIGEYICDYSEQIKEFAINIRIPEGMQAEGLRVPDFTDASVTVFTDGEEAEVQQGTAVVSNTVSEVSIVVKPVGGLILQESDMSITLIAVAEEKKNCEIKSSVSFRFFDGTEKELNIDEATVEMKGIYSEIDPEPEPDPQPEPSPQPEPDPSEEQKEDETADKDTETAKENSNEVTQEKVLPVVIKVVDHTGLDIGNTTASVVGTRNTGSIFDSIYASDSGQSASEYFEKEKIETASVEDASAVVKELQEKANEAENSYRHREKKADTSQMSEKESDEKSGSKSSGIVVPALISLAIAAVITVLLIYLGIRRKQNEQGTAETTESDEKESI